MGAMAFILSAYGPAIISIVIIILVLIIPIIFSSIRKG